MRDVAAWRESIARRLRPWPHAGTISLSAFIDTEYALSVLASTAPEWSALDAWTLFTGYPFTTARGLDLDEQQRLRLERARFRIPSLRHRTWREQLRDYSKLPEELRAFAFELDESLETPGPCFDRPPRARGDRGVMQRLADLAQAADAVPPPLEKPMGTADSGEHLFFVKERQHSIDLPPGTAQPQPPQFDPAETLRGAGKPITVSRDELYQCARDMDAAEARDTTGSGGDWVRRLARIELRIRANEKEAFAGGEDWTLTIEGLLHLVGMVGAGKSTLRDLLAYHCVRNLGLRVGMIVPDVAESLAVVETLTRTGVRAAPVVGKSTRGDHLRRLHRRQYGPGNPTLLHHRHPSFAFLSSACPIDAMRGREAKRPLAIEEAPCTGLQAVEDSGRISPERRICPFWSKCPRHHAWRELQQADVWAANPWSLVYTPVPEAQSGQRLRMLELMARHCDLIIVDEVDRVQLHFDSTFAPAVTLYGRGRESWLDELTGHQVRELADAARSQLADGLADQWLSAVNTINAAANQIFSMLLGDRNLRDWVGIEYFSAYTLHFRLLSEWYGPADAAPTDERERAANVLDAFRDAPLWARDTSDGDLDVTETALFNRLVSIAVELVGVGATGTSRDRLADLIADLSGGAEPEERQIRRLHFTVLVAVLHNRLNFLTWGWQRVESKLNLHGTANPLQHNPPRDYDPVIAESPIGNVLGFQFLIDDLDRDEGGTLKFFRCLGLGRELLRRLDVFARIDGRPKPHVMLMSATSWAGKSTRYHLGVPVKAVLRPKQEEINEVARSEFRKEPVYTEEGVPLRMSGTHPRDRVAVLAQMLKALAAPEPGISDGTSLFELELDELDPQRRRLLLLTGSYAEARAAFAYLETLPRWKGKVLHLVPDDADDAAWGTLRRGDVKAFPDRDAELLVAPMLAVERGHNIVVDGGQAAFGTAYFLVRPHDPPDDINLAIHALNDWAVRMIDGGGFTSLVRHAASADDAGREFRWKARERWRFLLHRRPAWSSLAEHERIAFTWDQLVSIWQVIGRLVRGGVAARVKFVDAAFAPKEAVGNGADTAADSLLVSMREVLRPYFEDDPTTDSGDRFLVRELYLPLYQALKTIDG
ncbi:signal recognition particle [Glycomyces sp. NPDC047369]